MTSILNVTKETSVKINMFLLFGSIVSAFTLGGSFWSFKSRFERMEMAVTQDRWTYQMEETVWIDFLNRNPGLVAPDVHGTHLRGVGKLTAANINDKNEPGS